MFGAWCHTTLIGSPAVPHLISPMWHCLAPNSWSMTPHTTQSFGFLLRGLFAMLLIRQYHVSYCHIDQCVLIFVTEKLQVEIKVNFLLFFQIFNFV